ncbi:MAG: Flp family type IVb pilin [Phyllobacteriaceae bacterium]|nr:Flp family type IVb pilin [Phyllobacteriaceae bacterium]MBA91374.1 Flp family type IVb pilin [Phyllobacteriaceae bacterium]
MARMFKRFLKDEKGTTAIEYALIASIISIAIFSAAASIGTSVNTGVKPVSDKLQ